MCISVYICVFVSTVPKEAGQMGVRSSAAGVTGGYELIDMDAGTKPRSSTRVAGACNCRAISPALKSTFGLFHDDIHSC